MKNKSIMIQGTGSSVGKSILATALCRILAQDGYDVNPFKSQNMSLNSFITEDGHEMGRAQVMQAEAARKAPSAKMNPILLKPTTNREAQIIFQGKVYANMDAVDYFEFKPQLKAAVSETYRELAAASDIVVIEGAGSPAEINLNKDDFVNMGMAKIANSPVILVGDIDKGGVFASLAGTMLLLTEEEKSMVKGVIINKFRGSYEILEPGLKMLEDIIHVPVLGVIPYFCLNLEDEDSVTDWLEYSETKKGELDVVVIGLPHISNFTDFNAVKLHEDVGLRFARLTDNLGQPDLIIIPGSKNTIADMKALAETGMSEKIRTCHQRGSIIFGICGGFQILGRELRDPLAVESGWGQVDGLGLLDVVTEFRPTKVTTLAQGVDTEFNCLIKGYEIHMGETELFHGTSPLSVLSTRNGLECRVEDGAVSQDRTVFGTYLHGIFDNAEFTRSLLNRVREIKGLQPLPNTARDYWQYKEEQYDKLAEIVRDNLDMEKLYQIVEAGLDA